MLDLHPLLRRERDSNPRRCYPQRFSRPPQSTTLPSLQKSFFPFPRLGFCVAERTRFELVVGLLLRQFSKLVVSATHPPLHFLSKFFRFCDCKGRTIFLNLQNFPALFSRKIDFVAAAASAWRGMQESVRLSSLRLLPDVPTVNDCASEENRGNVFVGRFSTNSFRSLTGNGRTWGTPLQAGITHHRYTRRCGRRHSTLPVQRFAHPSVTHPLRLGIFV